MTVPNGAKEAEVRVSGYMVRCGDGMVGAIARRDYSRQRSVACE